MSIDFIVRLVGMVVFCIVGVVLGADLGRLAHTSPEPTTFTIEQYALFLAA